MHPALHYLDLGLLFERIIRSWGGQWIQRIAFPSGVPTDLTIEQSVILAGSLNGFLNVRTTPAFSSWLRSQRGNTTLGSYSEEE